MSQTFYGSTRKFSIRDYLVPICIAIGAVIVIGIIAIVVHNRQGKVEDRRTAKVLELSGPCMIMREGATIEATADTPLYSGDTFFSGIGASARIMIDDDKFLFLDANTRINFTATGTPENSHTMVYVETGSMMTEVKEKVSYTTPLAGAEKGMGVHPAK